MTTLTPIAHAVEALERGEVEGLRACLELDAQFTVDDWRSAWYRISTLVGGLDIVPCETWGERRYEWTLSHRSFLAVGGPPRRVENVEQLRAELLGALRTPLTRSRHRQTLLRSVRAALEAWVTGVQARNVVGLARHHTDLPVDELSGWTELLECWDERRGWTESHALLVDANRPLLERIAGLLIDDGRFATLVEEGTRSPSPARRELCETLFLLPHA
jgi:hypothetical protein